MTEATDTPRGVAPWHLWLVGAVAVLWNGYGAFGYLMTHFRGEAFMRSAGMTEAQVAFAAGAPAWMTAAWAIGVWAALAGSLLLLLRSKWALHAFVVSIAGFLASMAYTHLLSDGGVVMGASGLAINVAVGVSLALFAVYAWRMTKRGVLR
ncbi:hypothetical protein [Phenylobacterium sp.]|uniref:hypothetical protein n=1 Tax=Phenylobacterium sp. TaxID=1871053 RepID=UPI00301BA45E